MREITITVNSAGKLTASNTTLGYAGEHLAVKVNFDVSAWAEVFPGAEIDNVSVLATINNARGYALVESKPQDGIVTWLPSAADMVTSGKVTIALVGTASQGEILQSESLNLAVLPTLSATGQTIDQQNAALAAKAGLIEIRFTRTDEGGLTDWTDKKDERIAQATIFDHGTKRTWSGYVKMKPQGTSSLAYDKKNFTINLYSDADCTGKDKTVIRKEWGAQRKYCLKANYIDPTQACNIVSARLARQMMDDYAALAAAPCHGLIDGFPALVWLNDDCTGLYTLNIPKDEWMFNMDPESNFNHIVLCAEEQSGSCAFTEAADAQAWSIEVGEDTEENIIAKFNRLVSFIKDTDDKTTFKNNANAYFNVDAALNYYLFCYVSCAVDNLGKNMLMVTYDGSHWIPSLYDMDGLWGVGYDGKTKYPATAPCPGAYQCTTSLLWQKLESFYPSELKARYALLRQGALSQDNILKAFREFVGAIPPQLYEYNTRRWLGMREMRRTLEQMEDWIPARLAYVDTAIQQIGGGAVIDPEIWDGSKLTGTFSSSGGAAEYINTEFIPFSDDNTAWTILARVSKSAVNETIYFSSFCEASTPGNMGMLARVVPASWLGQIGDAPTLHIQVVQPSTGTISHTWAVADLTGDYLDIAITRAENAYKIYFNNALVEQGNAPTLSAVTETLLIGAQWDSTREAVMRTGTMTIPYFEVVNSTLDAAAIAAKFATAPTAD